MGIKPRELKEYYKGVVVTPITPFKPETFEIDEEAWRKHVRFLIDSGIKKGEGLIVVGSSTAEFDTMSVNERKSVFKIAVDEAKGETLIVAGINSTDPKVSIDLAKYAEEIGMDGIMFGPTYYDPPQPEEIVKFYKMIADEIDLGICVYNNAYANQTDITVNILNELLDKIPSIIAIKESSSDFFKLENMVLTFKEKINMLTGLGAIFEPYSCMSGAVGFVAFSVVNFAPQVEIEIWNAIKAKDWTKAQELHIKNYDIFEFMYKEPTLHYVARAKAGMALIGREGGIVRPPKSPIPETEKEELKKILQKRGIL